MELGEVGLGFREFAERFTDWLRAREETHVAFFGLLDGTAVAVAWLAIVDRIPGPLGFDRKSGYVQSAYVQTAHRDLGLGAKLVAMLIADARDRGLDYLAVHPSDRSIALYERLGFIATDRVLELDFQGPAKS